MKQLKEKSKQQKIHADIEACEAAIKQSVTDEDFDKFESESDRMAFLKKKKAHFEEGLRNAETAEVGDAKKNGKCYPEGGQGNRTGLP